MPNISNKGANMPSSPIRKLVPYADAAAERGTKIYHLNIGQPDIETPDSFWQNLKNTNEKILSYCPSQGYEFFRKQFAKYYNTFLDNKIDFSDFLITTGASEALMFGMNSCLDSDDEIIVPEPMYANYISFAGSSSVKIVPITTKINNNFALPAIEEFEKLITPKTKAILICNPNNPTGYLYTKEELEVLKEIVLKHDLFLFVDEVYREFAYEGKTHYSSLNIEGLENNVVVFDSISKRFSACGARVGCMVTRNDEVWKTALKFAQARLSPPSLAQIAGADLFNLGEEFYQPIIKEYAERRDILLSSLNDIEGVILPNPGGAFYATVQLPISDSDYFCQWLLEEFEHEGATVMLAPGSGFYSTKGLGKNQVRIAYVLNKTDLKAAMECLKLGLAKFQALNDEKEALAFSSTH